LKVVIDIKNLSLYGGGIAHWFAPLLAAWLEHKKDWQFCLLGPSFNQAFLPQSGNWEHANVIWPNWLPRPLRHPFYDNWLFPRAILRLSPDLVMSPYHDVRMPTFVKSVITVHDLCLDELEDVYPYRIRSYYLALLRRNLLRASHVITVSQTSQLKIAQRYNVALDRISVVYNTSSHDSGFIATANDVSEFKFRFEVKSCFLLYSGGSDYRKNIDRLLSALALLHETKPYLELLVTGNFDVRWRKALHNASRSLKDLVKFTGKLSEHDLVIAYAAADAVVYPSLCEGFGRVCLEAMEAGTPLACADLPAMREVAGDYPCWFNPYDISSMVSAIEKTLQLKRVQAVRDDRFQATAVKKTFISAMDTLESHS